MSKGRVAICASINDKHGRPISEGDRVDVDDPQAGDMYNNAFTGRVIDVRPEENVVTVVDQDDEAFDVDADQVALAED